MVVSELVTATNDDDSVKKQEKIKNKQNSFFKDFKTENKFIINYI